MFFYRHSRLLTRAEVSGNIQIGYMAFGSYIQNEDGTLSRKQAKTDAQNNVVFDAQGNIEYEYIQVDSVNAQGDVILQPMPSFKAQTQKQVEILQQQVLAPLISKQEQASNHFMIILCPLIMLQ